MCLNFIQGGNCYATGGKCILGPKGASVKSESLVCELHGSYDVWIMQDDNVLVTDLGFPSDEPRRCLALGINHELAARIAGEQSRKTGSMIVTTQRRCLRCGSLFWISEHRVSSGTLETAKGYFCPNCALHETQESVVRELGVLGCWCG